MAIRAVVFDAAARELGMYVIRFQSTTQAIADIQARLRADSGGR